MAIFAPAESLPSPATLEETLVKIKPGLTGVPQRIYRQMFQLTFIALYNAQFRPGKSVL